jgi:hypothetical protein|tara:strand:- start:916 stop:1563 length:648 start_codon:yes stop_codon:yes gene_type:complete
MVSIGCGASIGYRARAEVKIEQSAKLTAEQRASVEAKVLGIRLELVQALRGEKYEPNATCSRCNRKLTPLEIIKGFNNDPNDFTTCCSACGYRFEPRLVCFVDGARIEVAFYCDCQTLEQLRGKENLSPKELCAKFPAIYRSAIIHNGSIKRSFKKIGINYLFEEVSIWKNKIKPFLGRLPDTVIANYVNVSPSTIGAMRKKLGIARYSKRMLLE